MKFRLFFIVSVSLVTFVYAAPVPQHVSDASIRPRIFSGEMLNQDISQENIYDSICQKGFTKTIRPAVVFTNGVKFKLMREAGIPTEDAGLYELDHIVPLAVGGHPRKLANLQLQPYEGEFGAKQKDRLEHKLHQMVCSGKIDLSTAQREIGSDWTKAYVRYIKHKNSH